MSLQTTIKSTLRGFRDQFRQEQPKLMVIGPPRSGFTLLISVLHNLIRHAKLKGTPLMHELQDYIPRASDDIDRTIRDYFKSHINPDNLIISPEFRLLVGGPKWIERDKKDNAFIRKYIGIKGRGDFLAIFTLPKFAMDYYPIIHSHYKPDVWLEDPYYSDYLKLSSVRNPVDILHSSVFSINALTGEYIDRFINEDETAIRENLALYKLTDLNFIEGLIAPLLGYFKTFMKVKDRYMIMRWEDLITEPEKTINAVAKNAGISEFGLNYHG